jgi:hypothetical protein
MFAEIVNHRFWLSDFEVYYKAAARILNGDNLYRYAEDDHYVFKYSPVSAIYYIPFTVLPLTFARFVYWIFLSLLIVSGFFLSARLTRDGVNGSFEAQKTNTVILLAGLILALHFLRELHLGQVNYLLLFIYTSALYFYIRGRNTSFSMLIAASLFLKPFALIFIPYLVVQKKFRTAALILSIAILIGLLPLLFYSSVSETLMQYRWWLDELGIELSHKQGLLDPANHTIFSVVARYTPLGFIMNSPIVAEIYQLILLVAIGIFVLVFIRTGKNEKGKVSLAANYISDFSLLIALIPLLAFTSENAFIFSQPMVFILLFCFNRFRLFEKFLAVTGFLLLGGNFSEALGRELSKTINDLSLISIGTIILIYLLFSVRQREGIDATQNSIVR